MAGDQDRDQRTEDATPQRIAKAREDGQVGFSADFMSGIVIATGVLMFWTMGGTFFQAICDAITNRMTDFEAMLVDPRMMIPAFMGDAGAIGIACGAVLLPIGMVAGVSGLMQTSFNLSMKPMELKLDKMSVKSGFGRIFSTKSLVKGAQSIAKASIIIYIVYFIANSKSDEIGLAGFGSFRDLMFLMCEILMYASAAIAAMMLVLGIIDLGYQKYKHLQDLQMSMQDIKDEHKESDGDPMIKARIRRLQMEMGRKRMLDDVPQASVVITNPTHFAVAVHYDRDTMQAPVVLAKGADHLARKIIAIAKENGVEVIERKPVARFLYANVDIGGAIPAELYAAVAEILNFVNRLRAGI
ncbi:EscU/YscU/HrcU family type III secretion system export apparatus switch protein [Planctomycetes bacterium K23_9]|uniref:Flagellar biosynthetic protein FlhB n=1 Tax=Stieleria marina TaxID=1930275 RepID=A0A517NVM6_9BACT|nr:Flagellar biosynthetic protein FlhB [Planctomycetes bacterium K23_9]